MTGRSQATPLTAWLRVPISWCRSQTASFFPDETHTSIRRTFTPEHEPHCKRTFCGYCGTHLSYWTEQPASEAEYLNVTVGSLLGEDIRALDDLGLLPEDVQTGSFATVGTDLNRARTSTVRQGSVGDISWFEEMIDGSRLGRSQKTRRERGVIADGITTIEWEVSEFDEGDEEKETGTGRGKRKITDVVAVDGADIDTKP